MIILKLDPCCISIKTPTVGVTAKAVVPSMTSKIAVQTKSPVKRQERVGNSRRQMRTDFSLRQDCR